MRPLGSTWKGVLVWFVAPSILLRVSSATISTCSRFFGDHEVTTLLSSYPGIHAATNPNPTSCVAFTSSNANIRRIRHDRCRMKTPQKFYYADDLLRNFQKIHFNMLHNIPPTMLFMGTKFKNFEEVLDVYYDMPVLVTFSSRMCGPCRLMKEQLDIVRDMMQDNVVLFSIDTDRFPSLGSRYNIKSLPTTLLFKNGDPVYKFQGIKSANELIKQVRMFS